jgi:hypothetical protein
VPFWETKLQSFYKVLCCGLGFRPGASVFFLSKWMVWQEMERWQLTGKEFKVGSGVRACSRKVS